MAYDAFSADRIRQFLEQRSVVFEEKKMMGGLCFMVDGKMCCGLDTDKNTDTPRLMCRVGPDNYDQALARAHSGPMDFTGRTMKGYVFVSQDGFDLDKDLDFWLQLCLDFNPFAKSSKKKGRKKT